MRAVSSMTIMSEHSAMSVPPATQNPCTLVMTGLSLWKSDMKPGTLAGTPRAAAPMRGRFRGRRSDHGAERTNPA